MKILALIFILILGGIPAFAHSCATLSRSSDEEHSKKLQTIAAIFYGEVVETGEPMRNQDEFKYGSQTIKIKVLRAWKGIETNETTVLYTRAYTTFEKEIGDIGTKKLFYAYKRDDGANLHIDFCSFTAFDDERMKRELGEGKVFAQAQFQQSLNAENSKDFFAGIWNRIASLFS